VIAIGDQQEIRLIRSSVSASGKTTTTKFRHDFVTALTRYMAFSPRRPALPKSARREGGFLRGPREFSSACFGKQATPDP
jgi:hypothetical protein